MASLFVSLTTHFPLCFLVQMWLQFPFIHWTYATKVWWSSFFCFLCFLLFSYTILDFCCCLLPLFAGECDVFIYYLDLMKICGNFYSHCNTLQKAHCHILFLNQFLRKQYSSLFIFVNFLAPSSKLIKSIILFASRMVYVYLANHILKQRHISFT